METISSIPLIPTVNKNTVGQVINPSNNIKIKSCPIENTFKIIGKRFTVLILRNMINGKQRIIYC
jgi:DNA-binding HxlR family transcriptional regulator